MLLERKRALPWLIAALFALVFGRGLFRNPDRLGTGDWDYFASHVQAADTTLFAHGQAPAWSPYHCGGIALFENFQSRVYSPSILLGIALGSNLGSRGALLAMLLLGFEGTRRFARRLGAGPWAAGFAAVAATGNGAVLAQAAAGHFGSMPYLLWPWWMLAVLEAEQRPARSALVGGSWLALSYLEAGMYPLVHGVMLAAAWCGFRALRARSWSPLRGLALVGAAGLGLCAFVLVPSVRFLLDHPRGEVASEMVPPSALWSMLLSTDVDLGQAARFPGQRWAWFEYASYVGPVFLCGLLFALVRAPRRPRVFGFCLAAALFTAWALGDFAPWSPWTLLHQLPILSSMRASARGMLPAIFCASIAAALALEHDRAARLACLLLAANLALVTPRTFAGVFSLPLEKTAPDPAFTQRAEINHFTLLSARGYSLMTRDVLEGRGALACYEPTRPTQGAHPLLRDAHGGRARWPAAEQWIEPAAETRLQLERWSPNEIALRVENVTQPATLYLNQNHHPDWKRADGVAVVDAGGLIATPLAPGSTRVVLRFASPQFRLLGAGSLAVLAALVVLARAEARRQRGTEAQP